MASKLLHKKLLRKVEEGLSLVDMQVHNDYCTYWDSITPRRAVEKWKRWVFAFLAPRTGWMENDIAYKAVTTMPWQTQDDLEDILLHVGVGLHSIKARSIHNMTSLVRARPQLMDAPSENGWDTQPNPWQAFRDYMALPPAVMIGAGQKTISFALELCYPRDCTAVCVDGHMLTWYGQKAVTPAGYAAIEDHWLETCEGFGLNPCMARHIIWDLEHGYKNNKYWASVFETGGINEIPLVETTVQVG